MNSKNKVTDMRLFEVKCLNLPTIKKISVLFSHDYTGKYANIANTGKNVGQSILTYFGRRI